MQYFYNWLIQERGSYRGQPIPNWFVLFLIIFFLINLIIYLISKKK
jgi:hypothetical protein